MPKSLEEVGGVRIGDQTGRQSTAEARESGEKKRGDRESQPNAQEIAIFEPRQEQPEGGQGITYWPLAEVLKEHLGIMENDPPSAVLDRLGSRQILGLTLGLDVAHGLHPLAARDQFQDAWVEFVEEIASGRTAVMLIEDIHWAEDLLVDLLERLVSHARAPLLLIVTGRPELLQQRPRWGAHAAGATVTLEPLASDDSRRMITDLLGGTLPPGLDAVIERAEGNPFFVEEVLGTLIDRGLLERTNGSWHLAELPHDFYVPDTVQAVVAARMDLLGEAEKQALQAAAVIGRRRR